MATPSSPLQSEADFLSPQVVKCVADLRGRALYFSRTPLGTYASSQGNYPSVRRHIGLYAYRRSFLDIYGTLPASPLQLAENLEQLRVLEHGYAIQLVEVSHASIGVDVPEDIRKVETLLWNLSPNTSSSPAALSPQ